jgi:type 2 lantibiotic biosynthesis protein LanM
VPSLTEEADWYRAATLRERPPHGGMKRAAPTAPGDRGGDADLARRRLARWREQAPFERDGHLASRLAADGLSREQFLALLGEPPQRLRERAGGSPPWLAELAAAFAAADSGSRLGPEDARKLGVLLVVEPLIVRARRRLQAAAEQAAAGGRGLLFAPRQAAAAFFDVLSENLGRALHRTLILELHVASRTGQIAGTSPEERLADFVDKLRRPDFALALLRQYPVAARHAVECAERWLAFAAEVLARLAADGDALRRALAPGGDPGLLAEVKGGVSDPHRGQKTVLLLRFSSGWRLVYKPKPLAVDAAFQRLLAWLNERGARPAFRPLRLLDRGDYGWVEHVDATGCRSAADVRRFYRRQGGFLALFYVTAATDFHYENSIAAGEHPMPVDLETLFHPPLAEVGLPARERLADDAVWDSVLRPGLLPQRSWEKDNGGVDLSGFGGARGQVTPGPVLTLERGGAELMRFTRKVSPIEIGGAHRPSLGGREVDPRRHARAIAQGFAAVYRLLVRHRDGLLAPDGPLAACAEAPVRILVRPTYVYDKLLTESFHPYVLQDALDRDRLLDWLWVEVDTRPGLARIIPWEHRDLERGDVPLFTSRPGSRDLWTSEGERIPAVLQESGLERAREILLQMGDADLARQLRIVEGTLGTLELQAREPIWPTYPLVEAEGPEPPERFLAAARAVADWLAERAFRHQASATWLGFRRLADAAWSFEPVAYGLYNGLSGIALFLGHLGAVSGESRYTELARAALAPVRAWVDSAGAAAAGIGGFTGLGSQVYAFLQLAVLWDEAELLERAEGLVEKLPARVEQDTGLDVVGGSAGCLLALLRLHAVRPSRRTLAAAVLCGDRLLAQAQEMETGLGWLVPGTGPRPLAGLSHGAAGFAWALAELAAATGDERFRRASRGAIAYERSLFSAAAGNWPDLRVDPSGDGPPAAGEFMCAWCHGAPGIGLARLACLPLLDEPELRGEIEAALATTLAQGFGTNHSLCHGDLGNLDLVLEAGRTLGRPDLLARASRLAAGILRGIEEHGWLTGAVFAPEIPGLMIGRAGIGYQLLRLAAGEEVPSVLLLAPPRAGGRRG